MHGDCHYWRHRPWQDSGRFRSRAVYDVTRTNLFDQPNSVIRGPLLPTRRGPSTGSSLPQTTLIRDLGLSIQILGVWQSKSIAGGLDLGLELETKALLWVMIWFYSMVFCKFSAEDNKPLYKPSNDIWWQAYVSRFELVYIIIITIIIIIIIITRQFIRRPNMSIKSLPLQSVM